MNAPTPRLYETFDDIIADPQRVAEFRSALGAQMARSPSPASAEIDRIELDLAITDEIHETVVLPGIAALDEAAEALALAAAAGAGDADVEEAAAGLIGALLEIQDTTKEITDRLRRLIEEIVVEAPDMKIETSAGTAQITAPSISATYDARKLDQRAAGDEDFAALVRPYRRETHRSGSLRVSRAKAVTA